MKNLAMISALTVLTACGEKGECEPREMKCDGEQVQTCTDDGNWGEPEACPDGQSCMEMDDGMQHCMAMEENVDDGEEMNSME